MPSVNRFIAVPVLTVPVLAVVASVASIAVQGFAYGISNNVFHVPLVLHDFALPQFKDDLFQQTLPRFASPVFPALSLVATRDTLPAWFFALHAATIPVDARVYLCPLLITGKLCLPLSVQSL